MCPELDFGFRHVDPQVLTQLLLHPVDKKHANVVHVHVCQDHVGHRRKLDAGGLQPMGQLPGPRQVQVGVVPQPGVDEDGLAATTHHDHVQPPVELIRRQEIVAEPSRPVGSIGVVAQHLAWQRQYTIAYNHYVNLADLQRVARRDQLVGRRFNGGV